MREPLLGQSAGDRQQIVAMLERQVRTVTVAAVAAKPLGKETLLPLTLVGEIAAKQRPQRGIRFDAVVEPVDQCFERSAASDTVQEIAAAERMVRLGAGKKATVLHGSARVRLGSSKNELASSPASHQGFTRRVPKRFARSNRTQRLFDCVSSSTHAATDHDRNIRVAWPGQAEPHRGGRLRGIVAKLVGCDTSQARQVELPNAAVVERCASLGNSPRGSANPSA